jgi:hypothetical protein
VTAAAITTQPSNTTVTAGASASFTVAASGTAPLTYQWQKGGVAVASGGTSATYAIASTVAGDAGSYTCTVSNSAGSVTSLPATLTVSTPIGGVAATLTVSGPAVYTPAGGTLTLTGSITYAGLSPTALGFTINLPSGWTLVSTAGTNVPASAPAAGASGALEFAYTTAPANQASFSVVVAYPAGLTGNQTIGASAVYRTPLSNLSVSSVVLSRIDPPVITTQPVNKAGVLGSSASFSVVATGTGGVTYQWRKGGTNIPGATSSTVTLTNLQAVDAGSYDVVVTNAAGSVASTPVTLLVMDVRATQALSGAGYQAGGTVTISNTITYTGSASSLGLQVLIPAGWSYASGSGSEGSVKPVVGTTDVLEWAWTTVPASPATFSYTLNVPTGTTGEKQVTAKVLFTQSGSTVQFFATPDPLPVPAAQAYHSADTDRNGKISLLELTRVIELYNTRNGTTRTGCYAVQAGSEDGFAPDPTRTGSAVVTLTSYHSADSDRNGKISLLELTRVIELYNTRSGTSRTGGYHILAGTEDGFAPGP